MLRFSEGKSCEAVLQCLEERTGQPRANIRWPEKERHPHPIDLAFTIGEQLFAMEHTGLEPFKGHIRMNIDADRHFKPIIDAVNRHLGQRNLMVELVIPAKCFQGRPMRDVRSIQGSIIEWTREIALTLPVRPIIERLRYRTPSFGPTRIAGVPFPLTIFRYDSMVISGHWFDIIASVPNAEHLRGERVQKAINTKFPKLAAWRHGENARTVLVLESNTIYSEDWALIAEQFTILAEGRSDRPDETYFVDSSRDHWIELPFMLGRKPVFGVPRENAQPSEFDPAKLRPLTKR